MTDQPAAPQLRVAIAHDYLTQRGGAERVVLAMARAFPGAAVHTTFYDRDHTYDEFDAIDVRPSALNHWSWLRRHHRFALPLLPFISSLKRIDADVVIASSSGWAHGFGRTGHMVVYCYTPARWLYQTDRYLGSHASIVERLLLRAVAPWLRRWDRRVAARADQYLAISEVVRERITEAYGRDSDVVPAPQTLVEATGAVLPPTIERFIRGHRYFVCVSRLLPYKNVDAVVEAFELLPDERLVVVGVGPQNDRLRAAASDNVLMVGGVDEEVLSELYESATAVVAASYEDFGLTPLEGASHGKPSVVLRWGGHLDTMIDGQTAVFFDEPKPDQVADAVRSCLEREWDTDLIRTRAARFSEERFIASLHTAVDKVAAAGSLP